MLFINYKGDTPQQRFYSLGVKGNNKANKIKFVVARHQADIDLSGYVCNLKVQNKEHDWLDLIMLDSAVNTTTDTIEYEWLMTSKSTQFRNLELQLEFISTDNESDVVFQTLICELELNETIKVGDEQPDKHELSVIKQMEGKIKNLEDNSLFKSDVVDNLNSQDETKVLSAKQGNVLKTMIENIDVENMVSTTYDELVALRDSGQLKAGKFYRITDYKTCFNANYTPLIKSAGHQFDIIVLALSNDSISEDAWACKHDGDTYFSNLGGWKLKYSLDNQGKANTPNEYKPNDAIFTDDDIWFVFDSTTTINGETYYIYSPASIGNTFDGWLGCKGHMPNAHDMLDKIIEDEDENWVIEEANYSETIEVQKPHGIILEMTDEWGNCLPYDFKNRLVRVACGKVDKVNRRLNVLDIQWYYQALGDAWLDNKFTEEKNFFENNMFEKGLNFSTNWFSTANGGGWEDYISQDLRDDLNYDEGRTLELIRIGGVNFDEPPILVEIDEYYDLYTFTLTNISDMGKITSSITDASMRGWNVRNNKINGYNFISIETAGAEVYDNVIEEKTIHNNTLDFNIIYQDFIGNVFNGEFFNGNIFAGGFNKYNRFNVATYGNVFLGYCAYNTYDDQNKNNLFAQSMTKNLFKNCENNIFANNNFNNNVCITIGDSVFKKPIYNCQFNAVGECIFDAKLYWCVFKNDVFGIHFHGYNQSASTHNLIVHQNIDPQTSKDFGNLLDYLLPTNTYSVIEILGGDEE